VLAASADSRRLVESAVISKSSESDFNAGICACAAQPRSGLAPMIPTRILLDIAFTLLLRVAPQQSSRAVSADRSASRVQSSIVRASPAPSHPDVRRTP